MPCYQVRTTSVELNNVRSIRRLVEAFRDLGAVDVFLTADESIVQGADSRGYLFSFERDSGILRTREGSKLTRSAVQRAYAERTVRDQAKRYGWKVTKLPNGQISVVKR